MANGVIISAHGKYAEGLKSGLDLVVGEMKNLQVVNFVEGDTYEIIDENLKNAYEKLEKCHNVVFITDLKGGTPFNRSVLLYGQNENVRVLSGLNFALTYQALISDEEDIEKYLKEIIETGKESIEYFELVKTDEEPLDDGI